MRARIAAASILFGLFSATIPAAPDGPSIDVGGVFLRIGMPQDEALSSLARIYRVFHMDVNDSWSVFQEGGPSVRELGVVQFKSGRVWTVNRYWDSAGDPATDLHDALMRRFAGSPGKCMVFLISKPIPPSVNLTCGDRTFTISGASSELRVVAGISESIGIWPKNEP